MILVSWILLSIPTRVFALDLKPFSSGVESCRFPTQQLSSEEANDLMANFKDFANEQVVGGGQKKVIETVSSLFFQPMMPRQPDSRLGKIIVIDRSTLLESANKHVHLYKVLGVATAIAGGDDIADGTDSVVVDMAATFMIGWFIALWLRLLVMMC